MQPGRSRQPGIDKGGIPHFWTKAPLYLCTPLLLFFLCSPPKVQIFPDEPIDKPADTVKFVEPQEPIEPISGIPTPKHNCLRPVYFEFDRADLCWNARNELNGMLGCLGEANLVIAGYCDDRGSVQYNFGLGQRRAVSVREYLIEKGIKNKIRCVSYGEGNPVVVGCVDESCWKQNRRVTINFDE